MSLYSNAVPTDDCFFQCISVYVCEYISVHVCGC
jgi:hypothetical protein